jgi:3-isopropylmalate dehydrogenase
MLRGRRVTAVHKANVLKIGDGMFLDACRAVAAEYPEITLDTVIVDAMIAHVVRDPRRFDVIVTTNMFGDILSDLTAELSGSLGLGGSLNAGTDHAMAQAAHGSAPDIAGQDVANPCSLILSAALLLGWHGRRHSRRPGDARCRRPPGHAGNGRGPGGLHPRQIGGRHRDRRQYWWNVLNHGLGQAWPG